MKNRELFDFYIKTQSAPPLNKSDVVTLDNLPSYKSTKAVPLPEEAGHKALFSRHIPPRQKQPFLRSRLT